MSYQLIPLVDSDTKLFPQPTLDALLTALGITDLSTLTAQQHTDVLSAIDTLTAAVQDIGYPQ